MPKVREGTIKVSEITIDEEYLSRVKPSLHLIDEYVEALTNGADLTVKEPIVLEEGTNKVFSGYHRVKAYQKYAGLRHKRHESAEVKETLDLWPEATLEVPCEFHACPEGVVPSLYAFTFNGLHGLRQSNEDAKDVCRKQ